MKKILVLSVGGSAEPIVKAIRNYKPDIVYFFCSSGPKGSEVTIDSSGDPCGDKRRSKCPECEHEYYPGDPKGKAIVLDSLGRLLDNYYYAYVARSISEMLLQPLDKSLQDKLIMLRTICEAFDLWDKFQHQKALELLVPFGSLFAPYLINVRKILGQVKATGYERVSDLLNNAERRAAQECYDDAIARLYRATELFAQVRLEKEYGYNSSDLKLKQLPDDLQSVYKRRVRGNKLILGLREDYELLLKLGDPVGTKYKEKEGRLVDAIKRRNYSISAHGLTPLVEEDYLYVKDKLKGIILDAANEIGLNLEMEQLPMREILP